MEVKSGEILAVLPDFGVVEQKSHSSSLDEATANKIREKIRGQKRDESEALVQELELPLPKRPRVTASRVNVRNTRASSAFVRPSIPARSVGSLPFRPPVGVFRPPLQARKDEIAKHTAELETPDVAAPPVPPVPVPHPPQHVEPPQEGFLEVGESTEEGSEKPEPTAIPALGPEAQRPNINLVPGKPNTPTLPSGGPVPTIPTPQKSSGLPQQAVPVPSAQGQSSLVPPPSTRPPSVLGTQSIPIPGAPQRPRPVPKSPRPALPVRPVRPPGLPKPAKGARGETSGSKIETPDPRLRSNVLVPGRPIVQRRVKAAPMPGIPAPTPGTPAGFIPRGAPALGGLRPAIPGRPPGGAPGRPGGPGRGAPGVRRPRPPQQRKRDLEALAERKILQRKRKAEITKAVNEEIFASDGTTVKELAEKLGIKASQIIKSLVERGQFATINQPLELESIKDIASHFGATATELTFEEEAVLDIDQDEALDDIEARPPVVTIMGHVDHGKTSLLDAIRSTNVAAREAGGITQAIGAYHVVKDGKRIVFIDTPGHEAFTKMRAHGASVTDIVILVVAADDGVMPQTVEAIDHAMAAKVPIIIAVNKIDLPKAEPDRVHQQLADRGLVPEDWGGDTIFCPVSAKTQEGIDHLLDMISLVAEVRELKANPARLAIGVVLEAKLDRGKGPVATVLTQNGTLRVGDSFVVGAVMGRVRALMDDRGAKVDEAGPSSAVVVLGLDDLPEPGDQLSVIADTDRAKKIVEYREEKAREQAIAATARLSLEQFQEQLAAGRVKELPIILKADLQGSATVLQDTLAKLTSDKVKVRLIHSGVGAIKESDILLAITASAIVVGFNVRPERSASALAEKEGIDIRLHTVIYELVDELKKAMAGLLEPIRREEILGRATVLEIFHITNVGTVAGCMLDEGVALSNASARLLRDNVVVHTGRLDSLRRFKDDVREVRTGQECGMHFERYNDVKKGDEIEIFKIVEVAQDINELIPV